MARVARDETVVTLAVTSRVSSKSCQNIARTIEKAIPGSGRDASKHEAIGEEKREGQRGVRLMKLFFLLGFSPKMRVVWHGVGSNSCRAICYSYPALKSDVLRTSTGMKISRE